MRKISRQKKAQETYRTNLLKEGAAMERTRLNRAAIDKKSSWRVRRNGEVYVHGELVGSLLRRHYGTRVDDSAWVFKPRVQYRKLLGVVEANTKHEVMDSITRTLRQESLNHEEV